MLIISSRDNENEIIETQNNNNKKQTKAEKNKGRQKL